MIKWYWTCKDGLAYLHDQPLAFPYDDRINPERGQAYTLESLEACISNIKINRHAYRTQESFNENLEKFRKGLSCLRYHWQSQAPSKVFSHNCDEEVINTLQFVMG